MEPCTRAADTREKNVRAALATVAFALAWVALLFGI